MYAIDRAAFNWKILELHNEWVASELPSLEGTVYDLGCGTAPYRDEILAATGAYVGVDWAGSMHDPRHVDVDADLNLPLPIADGAADSAVCFQVLEHLCEPAAFLRETARILRPGGRLLLSTPFLWNVHEAPHDYFRYTRFGLRHLLEAAGFVDIEIRETTGFWVTWILRFNYHSRRWYRRPFRRILDAIWWLDQRVAGPLDQRFPQPEATAGYATTARRGPATGPAAP